jgi:hypothetical protein
MLTAPAWRSNDPDLLKKLKSVDFPLPIFLYIVPILSSVVSGLDPHPTFQLVSDPK